MSVLGPMDERSGYSETVDPIAQPLAVSYVEDESIMMPHGRPC